MLTQDGQVLPTPVYPEKIARLLCVYSVIMLLFRFTAHLVSISGSCGLNASRVNLRNHYEEYTCSLIVSDRRFYLFCNLSLEVFSPTGTSY